MADGVDVFTDRGVEAVRRAGARRHAPQAGRPCGERARRLERAAVGLPHQPNLAVLHTDTSLLPQARKAWAAWNSSAAAWRSRRGAVCLHY